MDVFALDVFVLDVLTLDVLDSGLRGRFHVQWPWHNNHLVIITYVLLH